MVNDKISVCVATYNGEKYIQEQLLSILNQLPHSYDEIIISDDKSTDNTLLKIRELDDDRIIVFSSNARNVIYNFENALNKVTGKYIFLADQDDIWAENKIEKMVSVLDENLLAFSNLIPFTDKDAINPKNTIYKKGQDQSGIIKNILKNRYTGAVMAFNKELLELALPFPKNIPMHDVWLGLIAEFYGNVQYIDEPLIYYRRHGNNLSETGEKSSKSLIEKIILRYNLITSLCKRVWDLKK